MGAAPGCRGQPSWCRLSRGPDLVVTVLDAAERIFQAHSACQQERGRGLGRGLGAVGDRAQAFPPRRRGDWSDTSNRASPLSSFGKEPRPSWASSEGDIGPDVTGDMVPLPNAAAVAMSAQQTPLVTTSSHTQSGFTGGGAHGADNQRTPLCSSTCMTTLLDMFFILPHQAMCDPTSQRRLPGEYMSRIRCRIPVPVRADGIRRHQNVPACVEGPTRTQPDRGHSADDRARTS